MADTRNDVVVTKNTWVNLYTASGITVGTACTVVNKGNNPFYVCISATAPSVPTTGSPKGFPVYPNGLFNSSFAALASASGLWAYSPTSQDGLALVQD